MKVELLRSCVGGDARSHFLTSLLVDERLALDIGGLGFSGDLAKQHRVRDVFFTHAHFDHIASLPFFLENVFRCEPEPVRLHASAHAFEVLQKHVFNDELWPDFFNLTAGDDRFCACHELTAEVPVTVGDLTVTPVEVPHPVPAFGYVVASPAASFVFAPDTGPTERLWEVARAAPNLKAVFVDVSFPESLCWLAEVSQHLTPSMLAAELKKLGLTVPVYAIHLKASYREQITAELASLGLPELEAVQPGREYQL